VALAVLMPAPQRHGPQVLHDPTHCTHIGAPTQLFQREHRSLPLLRPQVLEAQCRPTELLRLAAAPNNCQVQCLDAMVMGALLSLQVGVGVGVGVCVRESMCGGSMCACFCVRACAYCVHVFM